MTRSKDMFSVLIVSGKEDMRRQLRSIPDRELFEAPVMAKNAEEARRLMLQSTYDLVMIDSPLPSVAGHELALDTAEKNNSAVILLVDSSRYDEIRYRVESEGVVTVAKPFSAETITTALNISMAAHNRILAIEEENKKLRFKMEEMRLCNRAKWALCENLGMDEPNAHRYIEKTAMNNRITRYAVAKQILKEYE